MALLPPLRDDPRIETNCGSDEPARDEVSFGLSINSDRMKLKNLGYFARSEGALIRAENLGNV